MSEKLGAQITFRLTDELYGLMQTIAKQQRRKPTEVARALLERGYAAYTRDGELFEPVDAAEAYAARLIHEMKQRGGTADQSAPHHTLVDFGEPAEDFKQNQIPNAPDSSPPPAQGNTIPIPRRTAFKPKKGRNRSIK